VAKQSRDRSRADFPVAIFAAYGPDDTRATKLVVSIAQNRNGDVKAARTWTIDEGDVRTDAAIQAEVRDFIAPHRVRQTVAAEYIIGCPHQEGIDYPMGRVCLRCPFWIGLDRFTLEPVSQPTASMSADALLRTLADDDPDLLEEALTSADALRATLVVPLLEVLERGVRQPQSISDEDASLFSYALYLMAKWRETRAYPHVVRWLTLPEDDTDELTGDIVTQDGGRILASVCDGDLDPIVALIVNREANQWGRSAGVTALALLAAWAEVPRDVVVDRLAWLLREGLERHAGAAWDSLAANCADVEAIELFPDLRQAYADGLVDPRFMHESELDEVEQTTRGETIRDIRERYPPVDDVIEATRWWDRRSGDYGEDGDELNPYDGPYGGGLEDGLDESVETPEPYRAPSKVGRNEPCPCGSGKKYKKCCGK
jgi:hypothetical protein